MFVWLFHRISGLLLVVLLPFQLVTGMIQSGSSNLETARLMADFHGHGFLNCLLAFLVIFHGVYGVRSTLLDLGLGRERLLFWICSLVGAALFALFLFFWMTVAVS